MIKEKSGLYFDKAKDFDTLCDDIFSVTNRTIGVNTIKRLIGYIGDDRNTNEYTLNTLAIYLGFSSWEELSKTIRIDSDWNYEDDAIYIKDLEENTYVEVKYLNRFVCFKVIVLSNEKILRVEKTENSSLSKGDILIISKIKKGEILEAKQVYRGKSIGNYRTNGEVSSVKCYK